MKITFYSETILNNNYADVFDTRSQIRDPETQEFRNSLEIYLDSLSKITIDIENVYMKEFGSLNIDLENLGLYNFFLYNYMKLEEFDEDNLLKQRRYYFIDNIDYRNDIVIISYSIDYWACYSNYMYLRKSLLTRSSELILNNNVDLRSYYKLPVEYDGNKELKITPLVSTLGSNMYLLGQFQIYKSTAEGKYQDREVFIGFIRIYDHSSTVHQTYIDFNRDNIQELTTKITLNIQKEYDDNTFYQVDNLVVLPLSMVDSNSDFATMMNLAKTNKKLTIETEENIDIDICSLKEFNSYQGYFINLKTFTIQNDFKNRYIGTLSEHFEIVNTGNNFTVKTLFTLTNYNFDIYLSYCNNIQRITDSFVINVPINVINGEEASLKSMTRTLDNVNTGLKMAVNVASLVGDIKSGNILGNRSRSEEHIRHNKAGQITSRKTESVSALGGGVLKDVANIGLGITDFISINAPYYSNTSGTYVENEGLLNATYGIVLLQIDPSNSTYVSEAVKESGYIVYKIGDTNLLIFKPEINHIFIKFDYANVYGPFSNDVRIILENILISGVKIHMKGLVD